jgi:hypothetical protein
MVMSSTQLLILTLWKIYLSNDEIYRVKSLEMQFYIKSNQTLRKCFIYAANISENGTIHPQSIIYQSAPQSWQSKLSRLLPLRPELHCLYLEPRSL